MTVNGMNGIGQELLTEYTNNAASNTKVNAFKNVFEKAKDSKDDKKLKEACKDLEEYFVNLLLKEMRKSSIKDSTFDTNESKTYTEQLDQQYAKIITNTSGIGIADMLYKDLSKK